MKIRGWHKYQHYKKRSPPWIKLHYDLLSSRDWVMLDDASRVLAIASMLLASRHDGEIPNDPEYVKRVAYLNSDPDFNPLIECGFIEDASIMLADAINCQANARPETETETETERVKTNGASRPIPYQEIVNLYHETCSRLPTVQKLTPARRTQIAARYREDLTDLDQWKTFFCHVAGAPFLNGDNDRGWKADLEWITKQGNYAKIIEGKYNRMRKPPERTGFENL